MTARATRKRQPGEPPDASGAMEIAIRFLGARPRTRWELDRRLRRGGVREPDIDATLARLAKTGYVDDAAFARWWGVQRDRHAPRGRRMIEAELRQHGIERDVIEAYRAEHVQPERAPEDEELPGTEEDRADVALRRHLKDRPLPVEEKSRQRIGMYLVRRGFDPGTVRGAIRRAELLIDESGER